MSKARFTEEFKIAAVKQVADHGRPVAEVKRLRTEVKRLTEERDILKKAAVCSTGQRNTWFILAINGGVYEKRAKRKFTDTELARC